jgi:hypothetical protein
MVNVNKSYVNGFFLKVEGLRRKFKVKFSNFKLLA